MIDPKSKYQYDSLYRLLKATGREKDSLSMPDSSGYTPDFVPTNEPSSQTLRTYCELYKYDKLGNIAYVDHKDTCGSGSRTHWKRNYQYNTSKPNNYLLSIYTGSTPPSTAQFTYDDHGNLLEMPHLSAMNWDFADQLKSPEKEGKTTHYVYSGGERVRKVVMNTSGEEPYIKYERIYLGAYELYREYTPEEDLYHQRNTHHILDTQRKIALLEVKTLHEGEEVAEPTAIVRYQYTNHLDSACLELDENAEILSYEEYHPFGTTSYSLHTNDSEVSLKRYKYVHKERDDESGLYYYGARYYAPWLCRFISVDPLKDKYPFYATYQYAGNKPITFIDLDGLEEAKPRSGEVDPDTGVINVTLYIQADPEEEISTEKLNEISQHIRENVEDVFGQHSINGNQISAEGLNIVYVNPDLEGAELEAFKEMVTSEHNKFIQVGSGSSDPISKNHSYVSGDGATGYWYLNDIQTGNTAAHEFGHLLGLSDRYVETAITSPNSTLLDERRTLPISNIPVDLEYDYQNNLMSSIEGSQLTHFQLDIISDRTKIETSHSPENTIAVLNKTQFKRTESINIHNQTKKPFTINTKGGRLETPRYLKQVKSIFGNFKYKGSGVNLLKFGKKEIRESNREILLKHFFHE